MTIYSSARTFALLFSMLILPSGLAAQAQESGGPVLEILVAPADFLIPNLAKPVGVGYDGVTPYYDLVLQTIFFVNRGDETLRVEGGWIEVLRDGEVVQTVAIDPAEIDRAQAMASQYGQFGFEAGLDVQYSASIVTGIGVTLASSRTLEPNSAAVVDDYYLAMRGLPDAVRITASASTDGGRSVRASHTVPVKSYRTHNDYILPVEAGSWLIKSFPGVKGHHRWTAATEHAYDITIVDPRGSWAKGDVGDWREGLVPRWEDWYAYGKQVLAAADGVVFAVEKDVEFPLDVWGRKQAEGFDAYRARIEGLQMRLMLAPDADLNAVAGGNYIIIEHAGGEFSFYAHLAFGQVRVKKGDAVVQGQHIAGVGGTGEMPAVHLHFQVSDGPFATRSRTLPVQFTNIEANSAFAYLYPAGLAFEPSFFVTAK
jgi:murein DD-endopeptidase MepM/ murein hydrolase activator NlpD